MWTLTYLWGRGVRGFCGGVSGCWSRRLMPVLELSEQSGLQIEQRKRNVLLSPKGIGDRRFRAELEGAKFGGA